MAERDDERAGGATGRGGGGPAEPGPARSALDELSAYPFFADDDDDFASAVLGEATARAAAPAPFVAPPSAPLSAPPSAPFAAPPSTMPPTPPLAPAGASAPIERAAAPPRTATGGGAARSVAVAGRRRPIALVAALGAALLVIASLVVVRAPRATPSPTAPPVAVVAPSPEATATVAPPTIAPAMTAAAIATATVPPAPTAAPAAPAAPAVATATIAPPTVAPTITAREEPGALRQRAIARQAALRTAQLTVTIDYGDGVTVTTMVRFDRGSGAADARLAITETYRGVTGTRTNEFLQIGARAWQRTPGQPWQPVATTGGPAETLHPYLFPTGAATNLTLDGAVADTATLRWYDPAADTDVTLDVDRATATPQGWRQMLRASGQVVTVRYDEWDTPLDFPPAP